MLDILELPKDIMLQLPRLSFQGNCSLFIENHKGIQEISEEKIVILASGTKIVLLGEHLQILDYSELGVSIQGLFTEVQFL